MREGIPDEFLDYDEIDRRGGGTCRDEDFALLKCPGCSRVYLIDAEVEILFPDPEDLGQRLLVFGDPRAFCCIGCGRTFPETGAWIGPKAPQEMRVTWADLQASPWRWVTQRTREATS